MKQPTTPDEVKALHDILRRNPLHYLEVVEGWLRENPNDRNAHIDRHFAWLNLDVRHRALADMSKAADLKPDEDVFLSRSEVFRHLGQYEAALDDFDRSERMMPGEWEDLGFGLLFQADCHARLDDEEKALACCDRLPEDFRTPGIFDAPGRRQNGDRAAVAPHRRRGASAARRGERVSAGLGRLEARWRQEERQRAAIVLTPSRRCRKNGA